MNPESGKTYIAKKCCIANQPIVQIKILFETAKFYKIQQGYSVDFVSKERFKVEYELLDVIEDYQMHI